MVLISSEPISVQNLIALATNNIDLSQTKNDITGEIEFDFSNHLDSDGFVRVEKINPDWLSYDEEFLEKIPIPKKNFLLITYDNTSLLRKLLLMLAEKYFFYLDAECDDVTNLLQSSQLLNNEFWQRFIN